MRFKNSYQNLLTKSGIQIVNVVPQFFTPTYVLCVRNGRRITVDMMLKQIAYAIRFIKANFDVSQDKYKETINLLKILELRFMNRSSKNPRKTAMHFAVDVFHEIQDMHASNDELKKENEEISLVLDLLIEEFIKD